MEALFAHRQPSRSCDTGNVLRNDTIIRIIVQYIWKNNCTQTIVFGYLLSIFPFWIIFQEAKNHHDLISFKNFSGRL